MITSEDKLFLKMKYGLDLYCKEKFTAVMEHKIPYAFFKMYREYPYDTVFILYKEPDALFSVDKEAEFYYRLTTWSEEAS